ncbi:MAG: Rho termination factor N-terminal domain-containing protein [Syntrophobacterales bacterium]|jgi:hypothetical protein
MTEKEKKQPKEAKEPKAEKQPKEAKEPKAEKEIKEAKEPKAEKEPKEPKAEKESKEPKAEKEIKEPKEPKAEKESKKEEEPKEKKVTKEKKEKPLDRMTAKELREMALGLEGIVGVHAMNKSELIAAIKKAKGIEDKKVRRTDSDVRSIKRKIKELRNQQETMREAGEKDKVQILRRRISRLKKRTRRAAMAG